MKKTLSITRAELSAMFYSPIAWLLLVLFLVQCSIIYGNVANIYMVQQNLLKLYPANRQPATEFLLVKPGQGLYAIVVTYLYLYIPLLTMGLISREISSGTIRLLYSSPVKTAQIVWGKFLAMIAYNVLLVAILGIFGIVTACFVPHVDTGLIWSSLLGFYLLLGAYSAIGLFMSCLTSYQVVAALSTLAVFAALNFIGNLWQGIDFVRDLTYFLAIGGRTENMFAGLITSRDVLYFLLIIFLFLGFSMLLLRAAQESRPFWVRISRYAGLLILVVAAGYLSARPALVGYWDVTTAKTNTLTAASQALLKSTGEEPIEVTAYVNLLDMNFYLGKPAARHAYLRFWDKYIRFKPGIKFHFRYYYDATPMTTYMISKVYKGKTLKEVAQEFARINDVDLDDFEGPEMVPKIAGLADENKSFVMQVKYKGDSTFLRVFNDQPIWPNEVQVTAALKRVMHQVAIPKIAFLSGDLERNAGKDGERDYSMLTTAKQTRAALINNGFDTYTLQPGQAIPGDITALVIADPKTAFTPGTQDQLRSYIASGGNLLLTLESGKADIAAPLLQPLGVRMRSGFLVQVSKDKDEVPSVISSQVAEGGANMGQGAAVLYNSGKQVRMTGVTALDYDAQTPDSAGAFHVERVLLAGGKDCWWTPGKFVDDSVPPVFNAANGDEKGVFSPAVSLSRTVNGHEQHIVVTGDADFIANSHIGLQPNGLFASALFKWLSNGAFPMEISRPASKDIEFGITDRQLARTRILLSWILPALLGLAGAVLLIRRKRK